jgi:hypothetical protein
MIKHDRPILDGKDRGEVGTFGNKTNKISEIRDILYGTGESLQEKKEKEKKRKKKILNE